MWVKIKKNYAGPLGMFTEGQSMDLPEATVKKLGKRYCEKTCAPWEISLDPKVAKLNAAQDTLSAFEKDIVNLEKHKELLDGRITTRAKNIKACGKDEHSKLVKLHLIKLNEADAIKLDIIDLDIASAKKIIEASQSLIEKLRPQKPEQDNDAETNDNAGDKDDVTQESTETSEAENESETSAEESEQTQEQAEANDNAVGQDGQNGQANPKVQD